MKKPFLIRESIRALALCVAAAVVAVSALPALAQQRPPAPGSSSLEEQDKETDKKQMRQIYDAIQAYRKKHGDLPKWLSDLVPEFLSADALVSPIERRTGESRLLGYADPKLQTSYIYEFSANLAGATANRNREKPLTMKEWKQLQMEEFGPAVPLLRCHYYNPVLNLSFSGDFYETALFWESDPNTLALIARLGPGPGPKEQRTIDARVLDAESAQPLAGVQITIADRQSDLGPLPPRTVATSAEGRALIPLGLGVPQSATVAFRKAGFANEPLRWDSTDAFPRELTVKLRPAVTVGGAVHDENQRPVAGAIVTIRGAVADAVGQVVLVDYDSVTTDREGKWTSRAVPKDFKNLNLKLSHPEYLPAEYDQSDSETPSEKEVARSALISSRAVLQLQPGIDVKGLVLDAEKGPVPDAVVTLRNPAEPAKTRTLKTDTAGQFRFVVLEPGQFQLWVQAAGWAAAFKALDVEPGLKPIEFSLSRGRVVRGRVLDSEGKPIEGASVSVTPQEDQPHLAWAATTDAEGRFVWETAPDGAVALTATKAGLTPSTLPTGLGSGGELTFRLTKTFMLSGKVLDAESKQPIQQFRIIRGHVWNSADPAAVNWEFQQEKAGSEGEYSVTVDRDRGPMEVRYLVRADGYLPAESPAFPTTGWHTFDFELKKGTGPEGVIKTASGEPVQGAEVAIAGAGYLALAKAAFRNIGPANAYRTKTGEGGRFSLPAVLASPTIVAVHDRGYAEVPAAALANSGELVLQPWGRVEGVLKFGTKPAPDRDIMLAPKNTGPGSIQYDWETFRTKTDHEGKFVFEFVPPGPRQLVQLVPMAGRGWRWSHQQAIEVKSGEVTRVTYGGTGRPIIGKFVLSDPARKVDWSSGHHTFSTRFPRPPAGLRSREEMLAWQNSPEVKEARANHRSYAPQIAEDGSFRLENILPGTHDLNINLMESSPDRPFGGPPIGSLHQEVVVPEIPGGVTDEPIDLGELTVQVRSASSSSRAP